MADIEVKDLTLMTADITALDVIPITDVSTGETLKITTQTLLNATSLLPIKGRDGGDIGGYLMDGVNDYVTVPDDANLDVGTSDFSIEIFIYFNKIVDSQVIRKWDTATGFLLQLIASGSILYPRLQASGGSLIDLITNPIVLTANTWNHIVMTFDRDGNYVGYLNGIVKTTISIATFSADMSSASDLLLNGTVAPFSGVLPLFRLYNRVLTATEIAAIYNNGRPDLYSLVYSERNANNTSLTSGTLTIGKRYRLKDFIAGDNFTNVGAASNADGVEFVATGTTPATWTNSSEVIPIGCVAEYLPHNAGSLGWIESSGNQLSGSTSGSPICLTKESRPPHYRDIRKSIAANTNTTLTSIVPRGYKIVSIRAKGSDSLADIKIGSASAGEQIVAATTTSSTTPKLLTLAATANDAYSESSDVTLYARHDTSASGKTMDLIFHFEKVGN